MSNFSRIDVPNQRALKILVVVHGYPPHQTNGAELQTHRKCLWWKARGYSVRVVAANPVARNQTTAGAIQYSRQELDGIDVVRLTFSAPDHTRPFNETYHHPLLESALNDQINDFQPDLMYQTSGYVFGILPALLGFRHEIPTVLFATDFWHICPRITLLRPSGECCPGPVRLSQCAACRVSDREFIRRFGSRTAKVAWSLSQSLGHVARSMHLGDPIGVNEIENRSAAIRRSLASISLVVVNSQFLGRELEQLGIPRDRILIVRQGISTEEFRTDDVWREQSDAMVRLLYLGQISRHKGVDMLVDAVESLAGDGLAVQLSIHGMVTDSDERIQRLSSGAKLRATTVGPNLNRAQLVEALASHDAVVVPSRWYENSPNVILESFAAGRPVITANHGGMAEMVRHEIDGLLFRPGDEQSLRDSLRRLCTEQDLLPRLRAGITKPYGVDEEMRVEEAAIRALFDSTVRV